MEKRKLVLVTVKHTKKLGWIVVGDGVKSPLWLWTGREALEWGMSKGYQVAYRGKTYNDGGYLNGVKAEG